MIRKKIQNSSRIHLAAVGLMLLMFLTVIFMIIFDSISGGIPLEDTFINFMIRQNLSPFFFVFSRTLAQDVLHGIVSFVLLLSLYLFVWNFTVSVLRRTAGKYLPAVDLLDLTLGILGVTAALVITSSLLLTSYTSNLFGDPEWSDSSLQEHYFRNYFDRAPKTLDDMVHTIQSTANEPYHWRLLPIRNTLYHMIGTDGEYNLKFISRDGHFEAVYNLKGQKLSTKLQPWNMGTFNYSSPLDDLAKHAKYDIDPFLKWKNTADSPPLPAHITKLSMKQYKANPDAKKRYKHYVRLCSK